MKRGRQRQRERQRDRDRHRDRETQRDRGERGVWSQRKRIEIEVKY